MQLKEQVLLLEAQLEKQLESISFSQTYAEEVAQVGQTRHYTWVMMFSLCHCHVVVCA